MLRMPRVWSLALPLAIAVSSFCITGVQGRCTETVRSGSRGECVKVVQQAVGVTIDGIFGPKTKNAVIAYQRRQGLAADGIVGRNTWNSIYGEADTGSETGSETGNGCGCSYDYAGSSCSSGPQPGARRLLSFLLSNFGGTSMGIYNCRSVRGGSTMSLHAEGRAVDHGVDLDTGKRVFNYLISIACNNGIQEVIFNRKIWTSHNGIRSYNGQNPHVDHVHVGLNRCGAQKFNL